MNQSKFFRKELYGTTKAYSINKVMLQEDKNHEDWSSCQATIIELLSKHNKDASFGYIRTRSIADSEILIEGALPSQQSDTGQGDARGDMARFITSKVHQAVRDQETAVLSANDPRYLLSDNQTIDMEYYVANVLKRCLDAASADCLMMSAINANLTTHSSLSNDGSALYQLMQTLSPRFTVSGVGFGTLDYFGRLDAITDELNYDFWLPIVDKCFDLALELLSKELLAFATAMGMGEYTVAEGLDFAIIKPSAETVAEYNRVFNRFKAVNS